MPKEIAGTGRTDALRHMLLERRQEVLKQVEDLLARRRMAHSEQREDFVPDAGDLALQDADGNQQISLMEIRNHMREQIDEALRRVEEGRYGICEDCGREIGEGRLKAVPFARRCVECQGRVEAVELLEQEKDRSQI